MDFKRFFISIIKSLIVLLVATLVFSAVNYDIPKFIKGVFGDIYAYASPDVQKQVINGLAESCSALNDADAVTINQLCTNKSLFDSMKKNCDDYRELKRRGYKIMNEQQVKESCEKLESGELERVCDEFEAKKSLMPDLRKIGALCKDYTAGIINDKEFFSNVIGGALPTQLDMPNIGFLEKYNNAINFMNKNKIIYFFVLLFLIAVLYLLTLKVEPFLTILSQISFSIGVVIMLPYIIIILYDKFSGFDTTSLLDNMLGVISFGPKAIISVIMLMFLRTYNSFIVTIGIVFLVIGIFGKFYNFKKSKSYIKEKKHKAKMHKKENINTPSTAMKETTKKEKKS